MARKKIVTYYNNRYKGSLSDETCNMLESLMKAEDENSELSDLKNIIYEYDAITVDRIIEGQGSFSVPQDKVHLGTLRPEQTIGVGYLYVAKNCILGDSVGMGKTVEVAGLYNLLKTERAKQNPDKPYRMLVLTEKTLAGQLRNELVKFTGDFFDLIPEGTITVMNKFMTVHPYNMDMNCSLVGTHALFTTSRFIQWVELYKDEHGEFPFDMLIVDESSPLGGKTTNKIVQGYKLIAPYFDRIVFLNATPFETKLEIFYNQLNLLDPSMLPTKTEFQKEYCQMRWMGSYAIPSGKYKHQAEFREKIKYRYLARTRRQRGAVMEDCDGAVIYSNLSDAQKTLYPRTQMHQLVYDCPTYFDENIKFNEINVPKLNSLKQLLNNQCADASSILIFVYFRECQELVANWLKSQGYSVGVLNGGSSNSERLNAVNGFKNGSFRILVTNVQKGLNFGNCDYCIFYSFDANPSKMIQFEGRTTRNFDIIGKHIYLLCSRGHEEKRLKEVVAERAKATAEMSTTDLSVVMDILLKKSEENK